MQTLYKKRKKYLLGATLILGRRVSQFIFTLLYNPLSDSILGIANHGRANTLIQSGYLQYSEESSINSKPEQNTESNIHRYNKQCDYGKGNCQRFAFQYLTALFKWLDTIQFMGANFVPNKANDVSNRIISLTDLSPHWIAPYLFGSMMGPSSNKEKANQSDKISRYNSISLGESGIEYFCDQEKIEKIKDLTYSEFIQAHEEKRSDLRSPCQDYRLPHSLAFNYFYYTNNTEKSSLYYMIAAFHDDVPSITLSMPAIIRSRNGDHMTSANLWYDKFQNSLQEYNNLKERNGESGISLQKQADHNLKKAISELSLFILSQAYPQGITTGEIIDQQRISLTIKTLLSDCKKRPIACELIDLGLKVGGIQEDGLLIYPLSKEMNYQREPNDKMWRIMPQQQYQGP